MGSSDGKIREGVSALRWSAESGTSGFWRAKDLGLWKICRWTCCNCWRIWLAFRLRRLLDGDDVGLEGLLIRVTAATGGRRVTTGKAGQPSKHQQNIQRHGLQEKEIGKGPSPGHRISSTFLYAPVLRREGEFWEKRRRIGGGYQSNECAISISI